MLVSPRRRHIVTLLISASVLFSGCATQQQRDLPELGAWENRRAILADIDQWEFAGRIAVSAGDEGFNGKVWWRQNGIVFRARISGPLGVGTVFINGHGGELSVTDQDGVVTELDDAETELRTMYGWTIPVGSLRFWALGIPAPGLPAVETIDADGRLAALMQGGWDVVIDRYASGGGQPMPRRLNAVSDDVRVRLVIDNWTFL